MLSQKYAFVILTGIAYLSTGFIKTYTSTNNIWVDISLQNYFGWHYSFNLLSCHQFNFFWMGQFINILCQALGFPKGNI